VPGQAILNTKQNPTPCKPCGIRRALGPPSQASETAYFIYIDLFFLEADIPQAKVIY